MNHYTYMLIDPKSDMKYIGVRSCSCPIEEDTYKGSSRLMTRAEKQRCDKLIIKTFKTRDEAMQHEIELHDKYDVAVNPNFWNKCKSTSTGFTVLGTTREFTEEHKQKMSNNRQGSGNTTYKHDTEYEWRHKNGEVFTGTIEQMVKHSGKDCSSFYKIFKEKLLYASGWRVYKNNSSNITTSDFDGYYRKPRSEEVNNRVGALRKANKNNKKYRNKYLWVDKLGNEFKGSMYELLDSKSVYDHTTAKRVIIGRRNFASGWRIVKNFDTGCVTTDLNYGKGIKVKLTLDKIQ